MSQGINSDNNNGRWHPWKPAFRIRCKHCGYENIAENETQQRMVIDNHNAETYREHYHFIVIRPKNYTPPPKRVIHPITITYEEEEEEGEEETK